MALPHQRQGHSELAAAPRPVADGMHGPPMQLHESANQGEADADARGTCIVLTPFEEVEDSLQSFSRNAHAVVAKPEDGLIAVNRQSAVDDSFSRGVTRGVLQQVGKDLLEAGGIPGDADRSVSEIHLQRVLAALK